MDIVSILKKVKAAVENEIAPLQEGEGYNGPCQDQVDGVMNILNPIGPAIESVLEALSAAGVVADPQS